MTQLPAPPTQPETQRAMPPSLPRTLLPTLFSSLSRTTSSLSSTPTRWTLLRTLKSENPNDIVGELHGSAVFTPLRSSSAAPTSSSTPPTAASKPDSDTEPDQELLYGEEGSLPESFGPGLRWTKKYIWRLGRDGNVSVWFVKVDKNPDPESEEERDYLFHEFDFGLSPSAPGSGTDVISGEEFVTPPTPPEVPGAVKTKVIAARGNHLCINDMYRTAYAFRVEEGSGEVISWASRHVVRGPKKGQDIVNLYSRG